MKGLPRAAINFDGTANAFPDNVTFHFKMSKNVHCCDNKSRNLI